MSSSRVSFSIDRGGTFTDIYARSAAGKVYVMKLLSVDPQNYQDAPTEGIRRILEKEFKTQIPPSILIDSAMIDSIRMGTTVATNALLERQGEPFALLVTEGFKDILYIGNQSRPAIFDLKIEMPEVLYKEVVEVEERVILRQDVCGVEEFRTCEVKQGITGEDVLILKKLNLSKLTEDLRNLLNRGIYSVAVALVHSFNYPDHEKQVASLARSLGFKYVTISSEVMPMMKVVPRGFTTCADAYLTPHIQKYISGFCRGFKDELASCNLLFMQSDGGLTSVKRFSGSKAILSGPAGGVVGFAYTTRQDLQSDLPVIGFDMGGTSTDVSRFEQTFEHTYESTTAGVTIQAPQLDITTVAAGGGSKLTFRSGLFVVGPESTGAFPGPVCYRNGGSLAVTDANLCLGRLLPKYFPKIFGPEKNQSLDRKATVDAFRRLIDEINASSSQQTTMTVEEVAVGFTKVANEAMCRPIRSITQGKGYDTSKHVLACFGGAGGQHACAVARELGIQTVFVHRYASILSAYGMALADIVHETQEPASLHFLPEHYGRINERIEVLKAKSSEALSKQGVDQSHVEFEYYLNMRYEKTDFAVMTQPSNKNVVGQYCEEGDFQKSFTSKYEREFGFVIPNRLIVIDDIRVRAIGRSKMDVESQLEESKSPASAAEVTDCYFEGLGYVKTPVFLLGNLLANHSMDGPCMIIDDNNTILVEPNCVATITKSGNIKINIQKPAKSSVGLGVDPVQLSIFSHRFMSIAEEMGKVLQRTAISVNIKERLDFSCALFGPRGGLVSNAPHIPVHLGAMQEAVQFQLNSLGKSLCRGDVILSNHPRAGGSHLPDLTVITPVFYEQHPEPVFFVASRGHHADIGGITPGSMPSQSTRLSQEGATFTSFKLVEKGEFQEAALIEHLMAPAKMVGSSGTRALNDNISDLKAQIAANHKGIKLVTNLIKYYGLEVVQSYMKYVQENAELAVKDLLKMVAKKLGRCDLYAEDYMDDGSPIKLHVSIDKNNGTATFDFVGTGLEVYGNCNTPKAVTLSAIIYCLRCMVGYDIPLNQGCLKPVTINIPRNSILWPSDEAAVVGGNVLTSQRVVDVVFKAFEACAASQGCMNNITFGDESSGYYETVAGGAGAGPDWSGRSGVHTHMTNTRITDVEVIEKRYPIVVQKFSLKPNSGGRGLFSGGDGVERELLFRKNLVLSVLTERRVFAPYSLRGGECGTRGRNLLKFRTGRVVNLGSKASVIVEPGDVFRLETPGGGAYGATT